LEGIKLSTLRLGVLASGRGSNLQSIMDAAAAGKIGAKVAVVISDKEDAFALERARLAGIPAKKIKLATYASRCIENEILMYLRRNNKTRAEVSFDEPLNIDWDGNELLLSDVLGTENDVIYKYIEDEVDKKLLHLALQKLSGRERKIMELRFGLNNGMEKTQKEVADLLGISQSYISRLEKRIIKRLKKEIHRME
jgi:RNA polymerase sigma factor (sigma-70 family)